MDFENVISLNKVTKNEEKSFEARHSGGTCLKTIPKTIRNYDGKNLIYKKGLLKHLKINLADMQQSGLQKHRQIRKEDLDEHVARIHSHQPSLVSSIQLFICATCDEGFIQKSDLTNHTRVHYGLHSDEQQETLSLKQNDERKNLLNEVDAGISAERYIKGVKEKQQILYMCSKCEKKFSRIVDLCKHFNNIHIRPFWCVICDIGFIQKSALNNHIRVHHDLHPNENIQQNNMLNEIDAGSSTLHLGEKVKKKKLYNCRNCEKKFTRIVDLDEHFNSIHTSPFLCTICEKGFIKKSALINHMKVHCGLHPNEHFQQNDLLNEIDAGVKVNQWSFSCPACDKKFYRKVDFDKHTSSILHFCCITCNKGFIKKSDFRNHMHVHHPKEQQGMLSSKTHIERNNQFNEGKEHTSTENLDVRENQQSIYTCPKCEEQFNRKVDLDNHATEIHFNKEPSICGICRKFFEQKSAYTNHMRVHTGLHPNEQQEILSSKTNILQNYLLNGGKDFKIVCRKDIEEPHTLTGVKVNQWSFSCPACDKKFYRKVDFDKHTSSILHFCCITCNKGFIKKSDFRNHMHVHHPKEQQGMLSSKTHIERNNQFNEGKEHTSTENLDVRENQQSIYTCPKCEEQFNRKVDLDNHATEIHFNKEPSICGICRKFFEQKSAYTNHMRVHTGLHPNEQQEILSSKTNILQNYLLNGGKDFKIVCRKDIEEPHTLTGVIDKQEPQEDFQATSTNFCDDLFIKEEEEDDLISF